MSHYEYTVSMALDNQNPPFAALIMAAMRKADTENFQALARAFPDIETELQARYNAPGGFLGGEDKGRLPGPKTPPRPPAGREFA